MTKYYSEWSTVSSDTTGIAHSRTYTRFALHDLLVVGELFVRMVLNDLSISDSMIRQFFADRSMSDVLSLADAIARERGIPIGDTEALFDLEASEAEYARAFGDDEGLADACLALRALVLMFVDVLDLKDKKVKERLIHILGRTTSVTPAFKRGSSPKSW